MFSPVFSAPAWRATQADVIPKSPPGTQSSHSASFDVEDVRRARLGLAYLRLPGCDLARPGMIAGARIRPRREDPGDVPARQVGDLQRNAHAVDEDVEPVVAGPQRVRPGARRMDDAVAGPDLVDLPVLPGEAGAAEDVDDLLLGALDVRRRRPLAGVDLEPLQPDGDRPGRASEVAPDRAQVSELAAAALDVVPVRDELSRGRHVLPSRRRR